MKCNNCLTSSDNGRFHFTSIQGTHDILTFRSRTSINCKALSPFSQRLDLQILSLRCMATSSETSSYSSNQPSRPDVAERNTSAGKIFLTEASDQTTPQQIAMFHHYVQPSRLFFVRVHFCSHYLINTSAPITP